MNNIKPPFDATSEAGALGCVLSAAPTDAVAMLGRLHQDHFHDERNKAIFDALSELQKTGKALDVVALHQRLRDSGQLESVGFSYLQSLPDQTPSPAQFPSWLDTVRDFRSRREALAESNRLRDQAIAGLKPERIESDEQVFQRLAKLSRTDYDRCREYEADRLNVRRDTLDQEVDARREKKHTGIAESAQTTPWPEPVGGALLLDDLRETYLRFMSLPPHADVLLAVWTLHTYLFDCFTYTPYLHVTSPEKECGKSTLAELMNHLCANATTPGGMSAAAMFRRINSRRPTLLIDEWDTLSEENRLAALNILNTGFKFNGVYTICVGDDHEDRDFKTFCPKAIFGLSAAKMPDTTRSRCFTLKLQKKLPHEKIEKLTRKFDGMTVRSKCLRWANDNREALKRAEPAMPPRLSARQEDISEILLVIADASGGAWPDLTRRCLAHLFKADLNEEGNVGAELLKDVEVALGGRDRISSEDLVECLNRLEDRPWEGWNEGKGITKRQVAAKLRPYGVRPKGIWLNGRTVQGYVLEQLGDVFLRYLPHNPDSIHKNARPPVNIEQNEVLASASDAPPCESKNSIPSNNDRPSCVLVDENQSEAEQEAIRL